MGDIDLHIHSLFSDDGEFSVEELMDLAEKAKLKVAAIADHDSVNAPLAMRRLARVSTVRWIDAIEISCRLHDRDLHLLGYFIDPSDPRFTVIEERMRETEEKLTARRLELLEEHFKIAFPIDELRAFAAGKLLTGEKICEWLLRNEENKKHSELRCYFPNGSRSDNPMVNFYWDYLSQGKVAYLPADLPTLQACIDLIHDVGGVAILAHPGKNVKEDHHILDEMIKMGLDGLEVFSSYHSETQIAYYVEYAKKKQLKMTCGSDFHGKTKPRIKMGMSHCPLDAGEIIAPLERGRK
jgi:predicted metal-dependent phosphoesterase TrpH